MNEQIKLIILEDKSKFYTAFDSDRKPCKHCRKVIHWGYQENGRAGAIEEHEGKFRLHFPLCKILHSRRYTHGYVQLTDGVDTNIRQERRRYVR